jgi:NADH-quinone oxidoreductase subunit L
MLRITWITFGIAWLAIIGIPPFSGFFSKDKIIEAAFVGEGWRPWVFGGAALIGAGITAFYMSRVYFMTFHGRSRRWPSDAHPHESPALMTWPMIVLAFGSAGLGVALGATDALVDWLIPVTGEPPEGEPVVSAAVLITVTLVLVLLGGAFAFWRYAAQEVPEVAPRGSVMTRAARRDLFQDDVNEALFMRPGQYLTRSLVFVDNQWVDGAVRGLAALVGGLAGRLRRWQTGLVRSYAMSILAGVIAVVGGLLLVRI